MKLQALTFAFFALTAGFATATNQLQIDFSPAGSSRVSDYFSNAYAQQDLSPQGMYDISTNAPFGPANPFTIAPWSNFGTLTMSGASTGIGIENFTITGASGFNFNSVADGALFSILGSYGTALSGISGSVTLDSGVVTALNFSSTISLTFDAAPGLPYVGTLDITTGTFALFVDDDTVDFGFGPVRQSWDISGSSSASVIPEPSTGLLLLLGAAGYAAYRRLRA
jgi:hypothetical protein